MVMVVASLLDSRILPCTTINKLVTILEMLYGNPNRQGMAKRELNWLSQGNRDFAAYYAKFQRIMANLDYGNQAKVFAC